jgi:MSHA biogenesis protein MshI
MCSLPPINATALSEGSESQSADFQRVSVNKIDYSAAIIDSLTEANYVGKCHIVLNSQQAQIVQVDKPSVPDAEINGALKWQIKDLVSISPENMVLDYFDGPTQVGATEKINVVCSPINELKKLVSAVNDVNMKVTSITIPEFAFANLLPFDNDACLLVCQQPSEEIVLLIVKQGKLYFHRRLRGFTQIASKTEDEISMTVIDSLALEIQRSSDYFERQLKQAPIKDIKVLLPIDLEGYLARKLAENSHLPVSLLALPEAYQTQREYASAIGATMTETRASEQSQELMHVS